MTLRWITIVALCAICIALSAWYVIAGASSHNRRGDPGPERAVAATLLNAQEPTEAYASFVRATSIRSSQAQHLAAHAFGEELFAREGVDGLFACGSDFGFGCYHGFMSAFIAEHGVEALARLDDACAAAYGPLALGCFHGIGHGLVSFYGYDESALRLALSQCALMSWKGRYGGCADGAFMEFNLRTMQEDTGGANREFSYETRYAPCRGVEERMRVSCYFNLPEWWRQAFIAQPDALDTLGEYCARVEDMEEKTACFRGIGYAQAVPMDFQPERLAAACDRLSTLSLDSRLWCREGAAWALYGTGQSQGAKILCMVGLADAEERRCASEHLFVLQ